MTRPTSRGLALVAVAAATYVAARILGTWELYLIALAFAGMAGVALGLVVAGSRRLEVERSVTPARPVAGDPLEFSFRVRNGCRLPGLQIALAAATGSLGGPVDRVVVDTFGARADRTVTAGPWPARRGVHRLPAFVAVVEDPLGLVRARRVVGASLRVTVVPRLAELASCAPCENASGRHSGGRRRLPTRDAWEFRGIRPLTPGEPLNRVDWKSTAKTGSLMLREMEAATEDDITVLLSGAEAHDEGEPPDTSFEAAVRAAGSIAAFTLRTSHGVSLLLADNGWRPADLSPDAASHRRLLSVLAEAKPVGPVRLGPSLPAILANGAKTRRKILVLVVLSIDDGLVRALLDVRRQGHSVSVVHINDVADAAAAAGRPPGALSAAGVSYLSLSRHDDLKRALAAGPASRLARAR